MNNTRQKRSICRKPALSVGDKTLNSCPPALNALVKRSLNKEIKNFNVAEARREAALSAAGGPSQDAYHAWVEQNGGHEPVEANPDSLAEEDGIKFLPSKKDSALVNLLEEARQTFSDRERQAWNLVMRNCLSYQEAGDLLNISATTVQKYIERGKVKFIKFAQERKRVRKS